MSRDVELVVTIHVSDEAPATDVDVADAMLDFLCGGGDEDYPEWIESVTQCDPRRMAP